MSKALLLAKENNALLPYDLLTRHLRTGVTAEIMSAISNGGCY